MKRITSAKIVAFLFYIICTFWGSKSIAQQGFVSVGGDAVGPGGSISFTAGQLGATATKNKTGFVIEGLQQPGVLSNILAVSLILFTATANNKTNSVALTWITASESGNDYFEIQRSRDGKIFDSLAKSKAIGNSSAHNLYSYEDLQPFSGANYYRIKEVALDGSFVYSATQTVDLGAPGGGFKIGPNPTKHFVSIVTQRKSNANLRYRLLDMAGRMLNAGEIHSTDTRIDLNQFIPGIYILQIIQDNTVSKTFKIVKE